MRHAQGRALFQGECILHPGSRILMKVSNEFEQTRNSKYPVDLLTQVAMMSTKKSRNVIYFTCKGAKYQP